LLSGDTSFGIRANDPMAGRARRGQAAANTPTMVEFAELKALVEDLVHEVQKSGRSSNTSSSHEENSSVADENPFAQTVDGRQESALERLAKAIEGGDRNIR
ncbi:hypothetical protein AMTR_s00013p00048350, partial [Amborella trichopoda]